MLRQWSLFSLAMLFAASSFAQSPALHEYTALKTPGKITIDGKLNEPGWKAAPFTEPFVIYTNAAVPKFPTRCKLRRDGHGALYSLCGFPQCSICSQADGSRK